jgi:hypothetical protein
MFMSSVFRRLPVGVVFLLLLLSSVRGRASETDNKAFVVRVDARFPTFSKFGAGILFAHLNGNALIVTAKHVVTDTQPAQRISVTFFQMPKRQIDGVLLPCLPTDMDVAVISVSDNDLPAGLLPPDMFPAEIVGEPGNLRRGSDVFPIGHPHGVSWDIPVVADHVSLVEDDTIRFQSNFVNEGDSGGALVTSRGDIVGMVIEDEQPSALAIRIDTVKRLLKGHYGVQLKSHAAREAYDELTRKLTPLEFSGHNMDYFKDHNSWIQFWTTTSITGCAMAIKSGMSMRGYGNEVNHIGQADNESTLDLTSKVTSVVTTFVATEMAAPVLDQLGWNVVSPTPDALAVVTLQNDKLKLMSYWTITTSNWDGAHLNEMKRVFPRDRVYLFFSSQDDAKSFQADLAKAMEYCASYRDPD